MARHAGRERVAPAVGSLVLLAALGASLVAACGSGPASPAATAPPTPRPEPSVIPVDLDGRIYALECMGEAAPGTPTAVLVGGLGVPVATWRDVQASLAAEPVRTCAVDRPTVYAVPPGEERRTVAVWNRELRAALREAGIAGPVVLVGHSLGGLAVDLYARDHPDEVAGLVFLDAILPGFDERLEPMLVPSAREARRRDLELNEEGIEFDDVLASEAEVAAAAETRPLPAVPAAVIVHGDPFGEESAAWPSAEVEALWTELQAGLAGELGVEPVVATGSSHRIQQWRPDLVAEAVRTVSVLAP